MNTINLYTGNIGWTGKVRHAIEVQEGHRPRAICSDSFTWNGTKQPTMIKKETATKDNVTCKKCISRI